MLAFQTASGVGGSTSSQIAAKLPSSCGRRAGRAKNHQPVQVLSAIAPPAHVDAPDPGDLAHGTLDSALEDAELLRERVGEVAGLGEVSAWLEQQNERKSTRLAGALEPPTLIGPDVVLVA